MASGRSLAARLKILETVMECSRDAIFVKDKKGVYIFVNGAAAKNHFGLPKKEILSHRDSDLFPPERVKRIRRNDRKVMKTHTVLVSQEEREIDGITRCFKITKTPLIDVKGNVGGVVGVSEEMTQSMEHDRERRRLAGIVESTQDAIYSISIDSLVTSWNKAAEELFGYTKEEILEQPIEAFLIPSEIMEEARRIRQQVLNGEKIPPYTTQRLHRDGTRITVRVSLSSLHIHNGSIEGFSVIARRVPETHIQLVQDESSTIESKFL